MADKQSSEAFCFASELIIVTLGALGVAAMFQDYAIFYRHEVVTDESVILKYSVVIIASIAYTILVRKRRKWLKG